MANLYRDLGAAEDAAQEAATLTLTKWLDDGIPDKTGAWITTVARRSAVDKIRRERTGRDKTELLGRLEEPLADWRPTPVVALNHAVAVGEADGPHAALALLDDAALSESLADYPHYHSTRADLLRRLDRRVEAADEYRLALHTIRHDADRGFLERRLREVST